MAPKLLPGLSKMTKAFMKTKRRSRKKGSSRGSRSSSSKAKETPADDIPTIISTVQQVKPQVLRGSSYTTACSSSGYLTSSSMRSIDPALPTITTTTTSIPHHEVEMMEDTDVTWYSSDDTGSCCPSSPRMVPPSITRPSSMSMRQRALSQYSGQKEVLRRAEPAVHHSNSPSFRLRKRNRALSDHDFDQLLTMSRGWTFDPAETEQRKNEDSAMQEDSVHTHHRRRALGSTDFDRYIFAPTTATRSQSTSQLMVPTSPCRPSLESALRAKSETHLNREDEVHPFFRSQERTDTTFEV